jgi:hypothetical protein
VAPELPVRIIGRSTFPSEWNKIEKKEKVKKKV